MFIPFGVFSAGAGESNSFELISTTILGSTTASVTFNTSALSAYKHLQLRVVTRDSSAGATGAAGFWMRINSDTGNNYAWHRLTGVNNGVGSGAASSTNRILAGITSAAGSTSGVFGGSVVDILDYASTTKNKTIRGLSGANTSSSPEINLNSGVWLSTNAITTVECTTDTSFVAGSRFSLYGIRG